LTFVVPAYAGWLQLYYGLGLQLYDGLAGRWNFAPSRFLSYDATRSHLPTLQPNGLTGSILYHDGQFDDARLAITLLRTFLDHGGTAINYCKVVGLSKTHDRVTGVQAIADHQEFDLPAHAIVNATGIFVDQIRQLDDPHQPPLLSPSQGIHLVVDPHFLPGSSALMIPKTEDGRVLFALPWHGKVILGTTDTAVDQLAIEPRPLESEIDFVLRTAAQYLVNPPTRADVRSVFVGQRPLLRGHGSTAGLSREHLIQVAASGLITVTGGKWTTYRQMGQEVVDRIASYPSVTATLRLHGWSDRSIAAPFAVYGSDAIAVQHLPGADCLLHPRLPYVEAQVRWAARYELAQTVEDVLARRTRSLLLDAAASLDCAPRVAEILAEELPGFNVQIQEFNAIAQGYLLEPPVLPTYQSSDRDPSAKYPDHAAFPAQS
jgi:glycerol-3-phosphate dehydrogenase